MRLEQYLGIVKQCYTWSKFLGVTSGQIKPFWYKKVYLITRGSYPTRCMAGISYGGRNIEEKLGNAKSD